MHFKLSSCILSSELCDPLEAKKPREGGGGNLEVILVPMSGPEFQN